MIIVFSLFASGACKSVYANDSLKKDELKQLIKTTETNFGIPQRLLLAIVNTESDLNPYAVNIGGKSYMPTSFDEALGLIMEARSKGLTNIDIGLAQINWRWHHKDFSNIEKMLKPKDNIEYAASLLVKLKKQYGSWQEAVRHYHSSNIQYSIKYSRKVILSWLNI